jgi:cis-L-3-hydroxyproline dehydratase
MRSMKGSEDSARVKPFLSSGNNQSQIRYRIAGPHRVVQKMRVDAKRRAMDKGMGSIKGIPVLSGTASGPVLAADIGLSFMGGVDPRTGTVIDIHHPLHGQSVAGKILALPGGRGSCSGSLAIFELLTNGHAPAALVFSRKETILSLGVFIAAELFDRGIPILEVSEKQFADVSKSPYARISDDSITLSDSAFPEIKATAHLLPVDPDSFELTLKDRQMLTGEFGAAAQLAMRLILRTALLEGVTSLIDISSAHIDGCFYHGPASLMFARRLLELGAKVSVPSTTNAIRVDRLKWATQGVAQALGMASDELAEAYLAMGVCPSYTCAPYLLPDAPKRGEQIAWGESNAVAYANSVLGARTLKYPDYLDILVAITGRAPNADCHRPELRHAAIRIDLPVPKNPDDAYFALIGYHAGKIALSEIPVICGLENVAVSLDNLKAFSAAFATTSSAAMFHVSGVTPEAGTLAEATGGTGHLRQVMVSQSDLRETWAELNTAGSADIGLVALGNPHFSLTEIAALAALCKGRKMSMDVAMIVTCGREIYEQAAAAGYVQTIRDFGGQFLNDTCWCFITEPVVPPHIRNIATNSGKYAHYGPATVDKGFHFASLTRCVDAACTGEIDVSEPGWFEE